MMVTVSIIREPFIKVPITIVLIILIEAKLVKINRLLELEIYFLNLIQVFIIVQDILIMVIG